MALGRRARGFRNQLLLTILAAAITLTASYLTYVFNVPNPVIVLVVVMIFFTATISNVAGAASGICIILYAFFFFSVDHSFIHFKPVGAYKCRIIICSILIIYLMVAVIRKKYDSAYGKVLALNRQLEAKNEILNNESDHDTLTGLFNRRGGDRRLADLLDGTKTDQAPEGIGAVMAIIDIDNFKDVNDVYGHGGGDEVLRYLAQCMKEAFPEQSILIRYGGDEFEAVIYGKHFLEGMERIVEFAKSTFRTVHQGRTITFRISCGYALYPRQADSRRELFRMADTALYRAKTNGKHQAIMYEDDLGVGMQGTINFSMRNVSENLPVAFMVYRADEVEKILVVSNTLLELCNCQDMAEFRSYTGGTFRGFVHPDDVDAVERSIERQIRTNRYGIDCVDYRIRTRTGRIVRIHDLGRLVHDEQMGNLFYVVVYDRDVITKEISSDYVI